MAGEEPRRGNEGTGRDISIACRDYRFTPLPFSNSFLYPHEARLFSLLLLRFYGCCCWCNLRATGLSYVFTRFTVSRPTSKLDRVDPAAPAISHISFYLSRVPTTFRGAKKKSTRCSPQNKKKRSSQPPTANSRRFKEGFSLVSYMAEANGAAAGNGRAHAAWRPHRFPGTFMCV